MKRSWKIALLSLAAVLVLALIPVGIKAATDGDIDLYGDLWDAIAVLSGRVDAQEAEGQEQAAEMDELRERIAELEAREPEDPEPLPQEEPGGSAPPATPPPASGGGGNKPAPDPDPEPEPYVNPYAHLSLNGVYICTIDNVAHFGTYRIEADFPAPSPSNRKPYPVYSDGVVVCFTEKEKDRVVGWLAEDGIEYTITALQVDPLFKQIINNKTFGSRTDAIRYIESHIYRKPFKPDNPQMWHQNDPYFYQNWKG